MTTTRPPTARPTAERPTAEHPVRATTDDDGPSTGPRTPEQRLLTASLVVAPLLYLAADSTYAVRGWDDPAGGLLHVLGAVAYGFVVLCVARWLPAGSRLRGALVFTALVGMAGNVAYGFEAIHMSFGDVQLVDRTGAANVIKPLGLVFPLSLLLVAVALRRLGARWQAGAVLAATVLWPVAHIGNLPFLAVPASLLLVLALGSLAWPGAESGLRTGRPAGRDDT